MNFTIEGLERIGVAAGLALTIKATLLLVLAAAIVWLLRGRSAAARHFAWLLAMIGVLGVTVFSALPLGIGVHVPRWPQSVDLPRTPSPGEQARVAKIQDDVPVGTAAAGAIAPSRSARALPGLGAWALGLWLLGTVLTLAWFAIGHLGLARLARRAQPVVDPEWRGLVENLAAGIGLTRPIDLRGSRAVNTPLVYGLFRPGILLPLDADSWDGERRRVVLLHELAHVMRRDPLAQAMAWLTTSIYWFHPGVWIAAGRLRGESERACDDRVLTAGVAGPDYAAQLLSMMRRAHELRLSGSMGLAMARRSTLEKRLFSVLDQGRNRGLVTWRGRAAGIAGLTIALVFVGLARPMSRAVVANAASTTGESYANLEDNEANAGEYSGGGKQGHDGPVESVDKSVPATPGETLELDLDSGASVKIHGWTERRVEVRGSLSSPEDRPQEFRLERHGSRVVLRVAPKRSGGTSWTSNRLEIRVPRRFDVRIKSSGGEVSIVDLEGSVEGSTGGGELEIQNAHGRARLSTGGGDIRVTDCELSGSVSTGGGMVMLSRVRGGLRGSSGSGPVIYAEASTGTEYEAGDLSKVEVDESGTVITYGQSGKAKTPAPGGLLNVEKAGGDIRMKEAPNGVRANTGGGDIAIGRSSALVDASTGGGDIEIGPVAGSVRAATGAGQVRVILAPGKSQRTVDLNSGSGNVVLEVPRGLDVDLDLETSYTRESSPSRIRSDVPIQLEPTSDWDGREGTPRRYVRARSTKGGGVEVRIKTVNGNIEIRRTG